MTQEEALAEASLALRHIHGGARDARWLLAAAAGVGREQLATRDDALSAEVLARFRLMIAKRADHLPVSHLIGEREFYGRRFYVNGDVLDPRPETETLIEAALEEPFERVLDLGTGSGVILLTLLATHLQATGLGTDISIGALAMAEKNARRIGVVKRAQVIRSHWFNEVTGQFDLIISNPPYIPEPELDTLAPELSYEPRIALSDGGDGLSAYRAIFACAAEQLTPDGRVMVEFGAGQAADVEDIAQSYGWSDKSFRYDLDGRARVLVARTPL